ncbi:helix-turn-helix transcriptional regulator [Paenibacillus pasadenensis]|uniref:helix-turn-helix transcriptional regulator n=1 Tax=Paenibacillus pasadenensis TaxID=217090 RepID=UPI00040D5194|nr:WYL domain-containing protein [Paenibacillus pasadenensis]
MSEKSSKLLRALYLIQGKPGITTTELAERLEVTKTSVNRYITDLTYVAPLTTDVSGKVSKHYFSEDFAMQPLKLTDEELIALSLVPSLVDPDKLTPAFMTGHEKILATHRMEKVRQKQQGALIDDIAGIIQLGTPVHRPESRNLLQPIIQAILEQKTIRTEYHTQHSNETKQRDIDPYFLVPRDLKFYLIGYCHRAEAIRTFRVSRFLDVEPTERSFDKGGFNIRQHLKHTWSIDQGDKQVTCRVRFAPEVARYVLEEELFVQPWTKVDPDGSLQFEVKVDNEKEFIRWVLQYGPSAEILKPESARQAMREQIQAWSRMYG